MRNAYYAESENVVYFTDGTGGIRKTLDIRLGAYVKTWNHAGDAEQICAYGLPRGLTLDWNGKTEKAAAFQFMKDMKALPASSYERLAELAKAEKTAWEQRQREDAALYGDEY